MKKFAVWVVCTVMLVFGSCDEYGAHDNVIHNDSSYDISFKLKETDTYTIKSKTIMTVKNQIGAVVDSFESSVPKRVDYIQVETREGKFVDLDPIPIKVNNTLSFSVTLSAGGCLGTEPMSDIQLGFVDDANHSNTIYSLNPVFQVFAQGFPAVADFQIVDGVMYVTVR
jgi:hypothetical protein